ncbi:hypothetical protein Haur_1361 [Herpetosiphon aurantiacus DSM 785]|uniref:Uncharacterized protein n=2 Tax=Herpetosiphon TaxID=64 RepID=A9B2G1_HERA2|nr:hypothetical protein Haur_1361 [Herpetosiphon aurantiacus DSM 785]
MRVIVKNTRIKLINQRGYQMTEEKQSNLQGTIGLILAALSMVVPIVWSGIDKDVKSLSYAIISSSQIVSINEEAKEKIQITFDGTPVEDVRLILLEITNDGDIPIIKSDYEMPITIEIDNQEQILSANIVDVSPENLTIPLSVTNKRITLDPVLLNPEDKITIKILINNQSNINISSRIIGINNIKDTTIPKKSISSVVFLIFITFSVVAYAPLLIIENLRRKKNLLIWLNLVFQFIGFSTNLFVLITNMQDLIKYYPN